ncbi:sigma-70 family RNA polymerase sigma factor [Lignipirellula cremea]|uniref:RNA polymerase sigma factor RpoD n=1 Tax=Lignipirellula cremea TaxID=2528010 RepID=A0A518DND3_9BACT|nr:sigma-70 family RNA polymerase sigma factor [Lignipirellula cremea]QDU93345.1 RNA polymerase sigma factor RpoD [Lignipirellula cremea]
MCGTSTLSRVSKKSYATKQRKDSLAARAQLRERAERILQREIDFIPSEEFAELTEEMAFEPPVGPWRTAPSPAALRELPVYLQQMCAGHLLSPERERELFRQMNFCKFQAALLREQLDSELPDVSLMERIERLLRMGETARNEILSANLRLVISIVKKFATPRLSFDDLLSDGAASLLKAAEKFDYTRGFRFSTYAYRAIVGNTLRKMTDDRKRESRFAPLEPAQIDAPADADCSALSQARREWAGSQLTGLLEKLDQRERHIIEGRFALGATPTVQTFQSLADEYGISKERIRQLAERALKKLHEMAAQIQLDDMLDPAAL